METIASRKNPLVLLARRVADGDPQERGRMLLDGLHLVQEARAAGVALQTAAFATHALNAADGEARRLATSLANVGCRVVQVSDAVMDAMSPVSSPSGIVALAVRPKHDLAGILALGSAATTDRQAASGAAAAIEETNRDSRAAGSRSPAAGSLSSAAGSVSSAAGSLFPVDDSLSQADSVSSAGSSSAAGLVSSIGAVSSSGSVSAAGSVSSTGSVSSAGSASSTRSVSSAGSLSRAGSDAAGPLIIVVVDVQDPGNLGAIVRVAEAGGAAGVIACGASADPYGWKALRGAMGSAFRLPIVREGKAEEAIARLKGAGVRVLATAAQRAGAFYDRPLTGACAILLGGEGPGLSAELIAAADGVVSIPMQAPVESLNVAVSAAVIIYEARRQRAQVHEQQRITVRG